VATVKSMQTDARRNLSLRRALDKARDALLHRDYVEARKAIVKAGGLGPLPVRPTRVLWEIASRWLKATKNGEGGPLDPLFNTSEADEYLNKGDSLRACGDHAESLAFYRRAASVSPLSPEAIRDIGLANMALGDLTEASHWLRLVPEILGPERRKGPVTRELVADSYVNLARIELKRGHRAHAAGFALKALDVKADFEPARSFLWDMEQLVGNKADS